MLAKREDLEVLYEAAMIRRIVGIYFSPIGGTEAMTQALISELADKLEGACTDHIECECYDLLRMDEQALEFDDETVAVIGMPAYIGKIPLPAVMTMRDAVSAKGTYALTAVSYGSRSYGNALYELQHYAENQGFKVIGAGAFSVRYGARRRSGSFDWSHLDTNCIGEFGKAASDKIKRLSGCEIESLRIKPAPLEVTGKLPFHGVSRIAPGAAAFAEGLLDRISFFRNSSEWYL